MHIKTNLDTGRLLRKLVAGFIFQTSKKDAAGNLTGPNHEKLKATGFSVEQYNDMLKLFHNISTQLTRYNSKLN